MVLTKLLSNSIKLAESKNISNSLNINLEIHDGRFYNEYIEEGRYCLCDNDNLIH